MSGHSSHRECFPPAADDDPNNPILPPSLSLAPPRLAIHRDWRCPVLSARTNKPNPPAPTPILEAGAELDQLVTRPIATGLSNPPPSPPPFSTASPKYAGRQQAPAVRYCHHSLPQASIRPNCSFLTCLFATLDGWISSALNPPPHPPPWLPGPTEWTRSALAPSTSCPRPELLLLLLLHRPLFRRRRRRRRLCRRSPRRRPVVARMPCPPAVALASSRRPACPSSRCPTTTTSTPTTRAPTTTISTREPTLHSGPATPAP